MVAHVQSKPSGLQGDACDRVAQLLLRLLPLKAFTPSTMEELFFSGLIGSVQIDSIIPYILRMETAEYNLQMTGQNVASASIGDFGGLNGGQLTPGSVLADFNVQAVNGAPAPSSHGN